MGLFGDVFDIVTNTAKIAVDVTTVVMSPVVKPIKKATEVVGEGLKSIKETINETFD